MTRTCKVATVGFAALALALTFGVTNAKEKVKVGFIGPLTGGVSVNGLGGRNSADLAVKLRNAEPQSALIYYHSSPRARQP